MYSIEIESISKRFGKTQAVADVSFKVRPGEIFGLLGPNGAGKTTSLRMMLDIYKPDSGQIKIFGGEVDEAKKNRIGYMPEERGLYQEIPLERCLNYLGLLKGMSRAEINEEQSRMLELFELNNHRKAKVKDLSKGMQQKAQIIATLQHKPDLIVIDEPFTALDPINTQMIKDLLLGLKSEGKTIIMCTHQMHQVEELCDRILLINQGQSVLYGDLTQIRKDFSGNEVLVKTTDTPPTLQGVISESIQNGAVKYKLSDDGSPQDILEQLIKNNCPVESFQIATPSLSEIFIRVVGKGN